MATRKLQRRPSERVAGTVVEAKLMCVYVVVCQDLLDSLMTPGVDRTEVLLGELALHVPHVSF